MGLLIREMAAKIAKANRDRAPARTLLVRHPTRLVSACLPFDKLRAGSARLGLILAGLCLALALPAQAQTARSLEYQVKAAFLLNFTKFAEWPPVAFSASNSSIRICVTGEDPFGATLDRTLEGESVNGRRVEAARLLPGGNLWNCHVLFISPSERGRIAQIISDLRGSSVLTVSEAPGFADRGGMIEFVIVEGKVRFYINAAVAEAAGLKLSSRLLKVAVAVKGAQR